MSIEEVKRLENDAINKAEVRDKLKEAGPDPDKLASIAKDLGYAISKDDIMLYIKDKKAAMSDAELDNVAGGMSTDYVVVSNDPGPTTTETNQISLLFITQVVAGAGVAA